METSSKVTAEMLTAFHRGCQSTARDLAEMLYPLVISIVRRHLPRGEAEEDLSQEISLKMFSRLKQYSGPRAFEHWVTKIALNTSCDRLRQLERRRVMSYAELGAEEIQFLQRADSTKTPRSIEGSPGLARDLIDRLLAGLHPREAMIIRLLDLEEQSVAEVCELLDWKPSRVRVTAMRARRYLETLLLELEKSSALPS